MAQAVHKYCANGRLKTRSQEAPSPPQRLVDHWRTHRPYRCRFLHSAPQARLPEVDSAVWTDTVKRGPLLRQVRGPGSLVPREDKIRLIPAQTDSTVVRIRVLPGAQVQPGTVLMDLVDPELQQQLLDAQLQLQAAKADYINTQARLQSELMTQRAGAATVGADQKQAQLQAQTDKSLYDLGVISGLTYSASRGKADELNQRNDLENQRLTLNQKTIATELAVQQTKVQRAEAVLAPAPGLLNPSNLFVPFYTTKPEGSGIGLVLAQQIASAHKGSITLTNNPAPPGCVAEVRLPIDTQRIDPV